MKKLLIVFLLFSFVFNVYLSAQNLADKHFAGIGFSGVQMQGGEEASKIGSWGTLYFGHYFSERWGIDFRGGMGSVRPREDKDGVQYRTYLYPLNANVRYNLLEGSGFIPYLTAGLGLLAWNLRDVTNDDETTLPFSQDGKSVYSRTMKDAFAAVGVGTNFLLSETLSLDLSARYLAFIEHDVDITGYDNRNSGILEVGLGLSFLLGCYKDSDGDGYYDHLDGDPYHPEDFDGFQDEDGIPDYDNDGDGILDINDGAPNDPEDLDGFQDKDGIPDPDNDGDGILDIYDGDPLRAEDFDGFQDENGIPDPDNDLDGILDYEDECPNERETFNGYMDEDGCPDTRPEIFFEAEKPLILEGVNFDTGSANLTAEARGILDKVVTALQDYPEVELEIQGHTDDRGSKEFNITLSENRAQSVRTYLISKGITAERLKAKGYGPDKPIADNNTAEGRAMNRRIEFFKLK